MFKTHRTVILRYLIFLGLFFFALLTWLTHPLSVGGLSLIINIPIFTVISIGFVYFGFRILKLKQLRILAPLTLLVAFLVFVAFGSQVPKYSQEFVEYKLTEYGYRTFEKFSLIFKENKSEFERAISEIRAKVGEHECSKNTVTDKQFITLKQSFIGIPLRLHPDCYGREITIRVMDYHGLGEANTWEIYYFLDWKQGLQLEKMCGEGASCKEVAPGWIEYVFVT